MAKTIKNASASIGLMAWVGLWFWLTVSTLAPIVSNQPTRSLFGLALLLFVTWAVVNVFGFIAIVFRLATGKWLRWFSHQ